VIAEVISIDYTRFARKFSSPLPSQIISHWIIPLVLTVFGILATSAAVEVFPEETRLLWAPFDLLLAFQKRGGAGIRAATFFGGAVLVLPQLAINVAW
jgi:NCS1 family nucleobase:cation symporter-1